MPETLALLIPIAALAIPIVGTLTRHRQRMARLTGDGRLADKLAALEAESQDLRARIETLETIATLGEDAAPRIRVQAEPAERGLEEVDAEAEALRVSD